MRTERDQAARIVKRLDAALAALPGNGRPLPVGTCQQQHNERDGRRSRSLRRSQLRRLRCTDSPLEFQNERIVLERIQPSTAISNSARSDSPRMAGEFLTSSFQIFCRALVSQPDGASSSPLAFGSRSLAAQRTDSCCGHGIGTELGERLLGRALNASIYFVAATKF